MGTQEQYSVMASNWLATALADYRAYRARSGDPELKRIYLENYQRAKQRSAEYRHVAGSLAVDALPLP